MTILVVLLIIGLGLGGYFYMKRLDRDIDENVKKRLSEDDHEDMVDTLFSDDRGSKR